MLKERIRPLFMRSHSQELKVQRWFWLALSILLSIYLAWEPLQQALSHQYVVQDDARQHVFWMQRFSDPDLFPNDLLADYFQSVAPPVYAWFYQGFARLGLDPMVLHQLLPMPLLVIATIYGFGISCHLLPVPFAGFATAFFLNVSLWMRDDVVSATPVAFAYPLLLAFVYYWLKRSLLPTLVAIALLGSIYPQCALVAGGIAVATLVQRQYGQWQLSKQQPDYLNSGAVLGILAIVLLPYVLRDSAFGPVVSAEEARTLAAFSAEGWSHFFDPNPWMFWFCGKRSGILPTEWCEILINEDFWLLPPQLLLSLLLPVVLLLPKRLPLGRSLHPHSLILGQWLAISLILFLLSHAVIFDLHLPNRYTEHSLRLITAIASGLTLTIILNGLIRCFSVPRLKVPSAALSFIIIVAIILYPILLRGDEYSFPRTSYVVGEYQRIYRFLSNRPKEIVVASLTDEANSLPAFTGRSLFVGGEGFLLPYHWGYYQELTQRTEQLIQAQYSDNWNEVTTFVSDHNIDFWLIDENAFTEDYLANSAWLQQYPDAQIMAKEAIAPGTQPVLLTVLEQCTAVKQRNLRLLKTTCLQETAPPTLVD